MHSASNGKVEELDMSQIVIFARICCLMLLTTCGGLLLGHTRAAADNAFLPKFQLTSTIPTNGDLNPYGIAFVPADFPNGGKISPEDVLVANFNDILNCQGRGTTIIQFTPGNAKDSIAPAVSPGNPGNATTFFQGSQFGLTTALGVLKAGFVIVGNVPSPPDTQGCVNTAAAGVLQVIDRHGKLVTTLTDNGGGNIFGSPWDLTIANDQGSTAQVFVSNVLTGTVGRLDLAITSSTVTIHHSFVVAHGYTHRPDPMAFVLGPTGLALDSSGNLFVASTADNAIFKVPNAANPVPPAPVVGTKVFSDSHLRGPLALAFTPLGSLLTSNGDAINADPAHPSEIIEFTPSGAFIRESNIDAAPDAAFGLATTVNRFPFDFALVNDNNNTVAIYSVPFSK
jgi:hypothetical protein